MSTESKIHVVWDIQLLSICVTDRFLAVFKEPHPEGGHYLVTERLDALGVAVTTHKQFTDGRETDRLENRDHVIGLQLSADWNGEFTAVMRCATYFGMIRVGEDPYAVFSNYGEKWKQPPASA